MKLFEIIGAIEKIAPLSLQEPYDNAGLLTGNPEDEIRMALLCLDVSEAVLDEAIASGCNLVISHHPLVFSGIKKMTGKHYVERILLKAIRHEIALYAAHTNLDNARHGVSSKIAARLGLQNTEVLVPKKDLLLKLHTFVPVAYTQQVLHALFEAGAGSIGNYDHCSFSISGTGTFRGDETTKPFVGLKGHIHHEAENRIEVILPIWLKKQILQALHQSHPYETVAYDLVTLNNEWSEAGAGIIGTLPKPVSPGDFLQFVKERMNTKVIRHTGFIQRDIIKVAVCGGAGSDLFHHALAAGSDIFISADFKYHQFFDAGNDIMIADIGHYESEQYTPEIFAEILRENFPTFAVRFTSVDTNPIKYF